MELKRRIEIAGKAIAPVVLTAMLFVAGRACVESLGDDAPPFAPLEIQRLEVSPVILRPGQTITLLDGVCNVTDGPVQASIYLGAQSEGTTTFGTLTVDLLTKVNGNGQRVAVTDTAEGRISQVIEPGCTSTDPITATLPASLVPGRTWRLRAHIVVAGQNGQIQNLTRLSNPFLVQDEGQ